MPTQRSGRAPRVKIGDRIRLLAPIRDHHPPPGIPAGAEGTVNWLTPPRQQFQQIGVKWDNGRRLLVLPAEDKFEVL